MFLCKTLQSPAYQVKAPPLILTLHSMNAWAKDLGAEAAGITLLGDATGAFSNEWDVAFDATPLLGSKRSKRYAIRTQDGKVTQVAVEPDNTGITGMLSSAHC